MKLIRRNFIIVGIVCFVIFLIAAVASIYGIVNYLDNNGSESKQSYVVDDVYFGDDIQTLINKNGQSYVLDSSGENPNKISQGLSYDNIPLYNTNAHVDFAFTNNKLCSINVEIKGKREVVEEIFEQQSKKLEALKNVEKPKQWDYIDSSKNNIKRAAYVYYGEYGRSWELYLNKNKVKIKEYYEYYQHNYG